MSAALIQFEAVEYGTIFGCTISGIYSHTTGPRDKPNAAPNRTSPTRIRGYDAGESGRRNPTIIIAQAIPSRSAPKIKIVLLPNLAKSKEAAKMANTCSKLKIVVMSLPNSSETASCAICPP